MLDDIVESLLLRAVESEWGIRISTVNSVALKRKCYIARRGLMEQGVDSVQDLTLVDAPDGVMELWIMRRSKLNRDPRPPFMRDYASEG